MFKIRLLVASRKGLMSKKKVRKKQFCEISHGLWNITALSKTDKRTNLFCHSFRTVRWGWSRSNGQTTSLRNHRAESSVRYETHRCQRPASRTGCCRGDSRSLLATEKKLGTKGVKSIYWFTEVDDLWKWQLSKITQNFAHNCVESFAIKHRCQFWIMFCA